MSVLIDSSVIVALLIESDVKHDRAKELFHSFMDKSLGRLYVTDYVLDEVITHLWVREKSKGIVETAYDVLTGEKSGFNMIVTKYGHLSEIWSTWKKFAEYPKRPLSFTDASLLVIAEEYNIDHIATFDGEFSGLISVLQ